MSIVELLVRALGCLFWVLLAASNARAGGSPWTSLMWLFYALVALPFDEGSRLSVFTARVVAAVGCVGIVVVGVRV